MTTEQTVVRVDPDLESPHPEDHDDPVVQVLDMGSDKLLTRTTTLYNYSRDVGSLVELISYDEGNRIVMPGTIHSNLGAPEHVTATVVPGDRLNCPQGAVVFYEAKDGWRWRLRAANGRIVAESGESYVERRGAQDGFDVVMGLVLGHLAVIEED